MSGDRTMEVLKNAILLEKRGHAFYSMAAQQATTEPVRRFFSLMAEEEIHHIDILSEQFKSYTSEGKFRPRVRTEPAAFQTASEILTDQLKGQISAAGYEAAAIAAAMSMEQNAIQTYSRRANESRDANEKDLYEWLAKWETEHLNFLAALDKELREKIWNDNRFWPF